MFKGGDKKCCIPIVIPHDRQEGPFSLIRLQEGEVQRLGDKEYTEDLCIDSV